MGAESTPGGGGFFSPLRILGSLFGTTDFEAHTHEQLLAMVEAANPKSLETLSAQLVDAAKTITEIGEDLKTYITTVPWEGEAGKAMETWGEGAWKATLQLGEYSNVGGKWMGLAAQTLREVKQNMPPLDATAKGNVESAHKYRNMPDYKELLGPAQAKLREDKAQAVQQMNKLAQSYSLSTFVISAAEAPTFPPPPGEFVPKDERKAGGDLSRSTNAVPRERSVSGENPRRSAQVPVADVQSKPENSNFAPPQGVTEALRPGEPPVSRPTDQPVSMEIDSVGTLPPATTPQSQPPASSSLPVRPDGASPVMPGSVPPTFAKNPGLPSAAGSGATKGVSGGRGVVTPGLVGGVGPIGQVGSSGVAGSRMPLAREGGIVGGKPVMPTTNNPNGAIPRGTVVGTENTTGSRGGAMGRGMAGMAGGMYGGGPMGGADQSGVSGGRRLASEAGGVVGGRQQQPGQANARPFTPGGSGLVRGAGDQSQTGRTGMGGAAVNRPGSSPEESTGDRPDYLSEDEETWQQGSRRVVPPVID
ncbi:WXG100 family type VII secretion target [Streptomyces sp. NBC_00690]|uniref:WXG100 family type VII secretion target n=1 Tax=Streptomyces sp. NBC_00690 TaxID=2975808 RepID=UPI002E2DC0D5|nr:hypothetical protein [Streptomyces sp. NBC_00690]